MRVSNGMHAEMNHFLRTGDTLPSNYRGQPRTLAEKSEMVAKISDAAFQLEVKAIMHRLLRKYQIELPRPGYKAKWDYGGMPVPMDGMPIVLRPLR